MNEGAAEAIDGWARWTEAYLERAQAELKATTDKLRAGPLTADDLVDGMVRATNLWVTSMASLASEGLDAVTMVAKFTGQRTLRSKDLVVGQPGAWDLALTTPLTNAKQESLPAVSVALTRHHVDDGTSDTFAVKAVVNVAPAGLYVGEVTATSESGATEPVQVWIQVG
jgi:hypothetical protein